jgi:hypothetical protein
MELTAASPSVFGSGAARSALLASRRRQLIWSVMPEATPREKFAAALATPDVASSLYELAQTLKREGMTQLEMYRFFDEFRARLHHDDDSAQYNAVLDTMDFIAGWGNRARWIFDRELDRTLYDKAFMKDDGKA